MKKLLSMLFAVSCAAMLAGCCCGKDAEKPACGDKAECKQECAKKCCCGNARCKNCAGKCCKSAECKDCSKCCKQACPAKKCDKAPECKKECARKCDKAKTCSAK